MWPTILAGLGALQQYSQAKDAQKVQEAQNQLAAEKDRTAWVTKQWGQPTFTARNPYLTMLDGAMQGGMSGLAFQQQGGVGSSPEASEKALASITPRKNMYASLLNPQDPNEKWKLKSMYGINYEG